jgi:purine-binding chemotaxis protein CheW
MKSRPRQRTKFIDWQAIRDRLAQVLTATEQFLRFTPEKAQAILEERARVLARVPPSAAQVGAVIEVVTFGLANENYAIETRYVHEVVRFAEFTPLPGAPTFLVGVLNLRGEILGVMDPRTFFGVSGPGVTDLTRVLVLGVERVEFGMLADAVHEVRTLRIDELLEAPASVAGVGREYLRGVTKEALVVLDGAVLLQDTRLFIDQDEATGSSS